jgi:hypothetical protein
MLIEYEPAAAGVQLDEPVEAAYVPPLQGIAALLDATGT